MKCLLALTLALCLGTSTALASQKHNTLYPPHHQLWLCIHQHEAGSWHDHDSGGNGHYGGLQMSYNWLRIVSGDAGYMSEPQQEWAAETGYRLNGYHSWWLEGQWLRWDGAYQCLNYAQRE